jgi:hypothetical protein
MIDLLTDIRDSFARLDRDLKYLVPLVKSQGTLYAVKRIPLKTHGTWYPVEVPPNLRSWFVQAIPTTAKLYIGYGETNNLQEVPPIQNYSTIPAATTRTEDTTPRMIWLQSDTDNTIAELELWV